MHPFVSAWVFCFENVRKESLIISYSSARNTQSRACTCLKLTQREEIQLKDLKGKHARIDIPLSFYFVDLWRQEKDVYEISVNREIS